MARFYMRMSKLIHGYPPFLFLQDSEDQKSLVLGSYREGIGLTRELISAVCVPGPEKGNNF